MKVKFCHNNNANIHSKVVETFDTEADLGYSDEEWRAAPQEEKDRIVEEWAMQQFEFWIEEDEE